AAHWRCVRVAAAARVTGTDKGPFPPLAFRAGDPRVGARPRRELKGKYMAKTSAPKVKAAVPDGNASELLRRPAEIEYAAELEALRAADREARPDGWLLSPRAVRTYILGGKIGSAEVKPKYLGNERVVEIAIATLATDRALLLIGEPGTAKSWLSEHLAAAISGTSLMLVQGTAGTTEEQIRYSWNYALLLAEGPSPRALVPSPIYRAMQHGQL